MLRTSLVSTSFRLQFSGLSLYMIIFYVFKVFIFTSPVIIFSFPSKFKGITFSLHLFIGQFSNLYPRFQVKVFTDKSGLSMMLGSVREWEYASPPLPEPQAS